MGAILDKQWDKMQKTIAQDNFEISGIIPHCKMDARTGSIRNSKDFHAPIKESTKGDMTTINPKSPTKDSYSQTFSRKNCDDVNMQLDRGV